MPEGTSGYIPNKWRNIPSTFVGTSTETAAPTSALPASVDGLSVPIAASGSQGDTIIYRVFNTPVGDFPGWAAAVGAKPVTGDFNGDRRDDVALVGGAGWGSIPVAFFRGDGTSITVTNVAVPDFPSWATTAGAMPFTGDFNGDGLSDIALIGPSGWQSMPIAFSNGDGSFKVTNFPIGGGFNALAASGAKPVAGRFHPASIQTWDVALVGGTAVGSNIPVAISNGDGSFTVHNDSNNALSAFTARAAKSGMKPVAGDFDGDGGDDIAVVGNSSVQTVTVALSNRNSFGSFRLAGGTLADFAAAAAKAGAVPLSSRGGTPQR